MKKLLILIAVVLLAANFTSNAQQTIKIGVVDLATVVKELPDAKKADEDLKVLSQKFKDTLMNMQKSLEDRYKTYEKGKAMMPEDARKKEEEGLMGMDQQVKVYYESKFGQMGDLMKKQESLLEPIRNKVKKAIEKVAQDEKISIVLDKNQPALLYSEEKFDITFRVLDQIKRNQ